MTSTILRTAARVLMPLLLLFAVFLLLRGHNQPGGGFVGGLVVWSRAAGRLRRGLENAELREVAALRQSVQLCATYWHYLLLIWLVLFAVLLTT